MSGGNDGLQRVRRHYGGGFQSVGSAMGHALAKRVTTPLVAVDPRPEEMRALRTGRPEREKRRPGILVGRK